MADRRNSIRFDGADLKIQHLDINLVVEDPANPREHDQLHVDEIAASISRLGLNGAVVTDENLVLIAGTGMLRACLQLGLSKIPVIVLSHLSPAEKAALRIAYNRIAEKGRWSAKRLAESFEFILANDFELDLEITGYEVPEIDVLMLGGKDAIDAAASLAADEPEDIELPDLPEDPVSKLGDVFRIGEHLVGCGDGTSTDDIARLMGENRADLALTDFPYNVPGSRIGGRGSIGARNFVQGSGEMTSEQYQDFVARAAIQMRDFSKAGAYNCTFTGWYSMPDMLKGFEQVFQALAHIAIWAKTNGGMGSPWRNAWEGLLVYRVSGGKVRNNVQLGRHGRNRTDVFRYAGVNVFRKGRMEELEAHPTCKPVALLKDLILDITPIRGIVLDTFLGSGSTIIAAHLAKRRGIGNELDPRYVDVAVQRISSELCLPAIHENGMTFTELAAHRRKV